NTQASKAAAYALLARLYLNKAVYTAGSPEGPYSFAKEDMDKVVEYCELVEAEGFSLEDEYFKIFSTASSNEIILVAATGTPQNRYRMTLHYDQNPDGWNGFATLADFYDKFDENDPRRGSEATPDGTEYSGLGRGFLFGQQYNDAGDEIINSRNQLPLSFTKEVPLLGAGTEEGIRVIKYHPVDAGMYIFLRYGDVHLMKAEAVLRGGTDNQSALEIVNELRTARGATGLGTLDEASMLDERGRELYWEGLRRVDQIRFGTFTSPWSDMENTEAFRVLFPIPQRALDTNPNLQQNSGY
ncbi:MAG: RagB/SusD family nutrient uptake outer membrane protein, partial [Phaeodactylibacter sp.]|nr:RagB/SusD family nutrient uptake outer membrane protein [Phaeodactylibacter sp.]